VLLLIAGSFYLMHLAGEPFGEDDRDAL
jgi:hypothetical protein